MGPPAELLQEALVKAQDEPSSTWKMPFVTETVPWVSCHKHEAVEVQEVVIVGLEVL
jgi:flavin reductase (DIM6/NTAB) family NADH-FMN oxidoreductase RutF